MNLDPELEVLFNKIKAFAQSENLLGKPVTIKDVTLVPILNLSFGAGSGNAGKAWANSSARGVGGKIAPTALLILQNDAVRLFSLDSNTTIEEITDLLTGVISPGQGLTQ